MNYASAVKVYTTNEYDRFNLLHGNRDLKKGHLKRLGKSIQKLNLLDYTPIIVNENFQVIDGQHRLEIAKKNQIPISYIQVAGIALTETQDLNENIRAWVSMDFLESKIKLGLSDYLYFKEFKDKHKISFTVALMILSETYTTGEQLVNARQVFKAGNFQVKNQQRAENFVLDLLALKPFYLPTKGIFRQDNIVAVAKVRKELGLSRIIQKFHQYPHEKITEQRTAEGYVIQLNRIWNFDLHAKSRKKIY